MRVALFLFAVIPSAAAGQGVIAKIPTLVPVPPERVLSLTESELAAIGQYHLLRSQWELRAELDTTYSDRALELLLVNAEATLQQRKQVCISDYDAIRARLGTDAAISVLRYGVRRCGSEETYPPKDAIRAMQASNSEGENPDFTNDSPAEMAIRIGRIAVVGANLVPQVNATPKPASWRPGDQVKAAPIELPKPVVRDWTKRAGGEVATGELVKETTNGFAIIKQKDGEWIAVKTSTLSADDRKFIEAGR